ncbi:MAG: hypothetical protein QXJ06_00405 [Candidatus Aenigmatarchaeota archaeon]
METKIILGIVLGLIVLAILIYFISLSTNLFDNILEWLKALV